MKKLLSIFIIVLPILISVLPANLVFAETSDSKVFSYTVDEMKGITVKGTESIEESIYVMAGSYSDGKMVAMDMVELSAGNEKILTLQDWGQEVKLFAVSKDYMPVCSAKTVWADGEVVLNTEELESRMKEAKNLLDGDYLTSKDGSDVAVDKQWIPAEMRNGLQDALDAAQEYFLNEEFETQAQVDSSVEALEKAISAFKPAYGIPADTLDTSELESKLNEAEYLMNWGYQISTAGSDVPQDQKWVTAEMIENLTDAFAAAEWFYNDEFETQEQVDTAVADFEEAIEAFQPANGMLS